MVTAYICNLNEAARVHGGVAARLRHLFENKDVFFASITAAAPAPPKPKTSTSVVRSHFMSSVATRATAEALLASARPDPTKPSANFKKFRFEIAEAIWILL